MAVKSRSRKKRKLAAKYKRRRAAVAIILIGIIVAICFFIDYLQRREEAGLVGGQKTASPGLESPSSESSIKASATPGSGQAPRSTSPAVSPGTSQGTATQPAVHELDFSAVLYFPNEDFSYLSKLSVSLKYKGPAAKVSEISKADRIKLAMEALVKGPANDINRNFLPKGTKVLDVQVDGKKAVINFSREFRDNQGSSSLSARMTLGQVVLTCSELGIDEVSILIEGKAVEDYPGGIDLSKPVRKMDYVYLIE